MFEIYGLNSHELMPLARMFERNVKKTRAIEGATFELDRQEAKKALQAYNNVNQVSNNSNAVVAGDIMSAPVVTLLLDNTLREALSRLQKNNVRHLPVISNDERLVGIVSERDILRCLSGITISDQPTKEPLLSDGVKTIVKGRVCAANVDTDIRHIARLFVEQRIGAMPIVRDARVEGIITRHDILSAVMRRYAVELWI